MQKMLENFKEYGIGDLQKQRKAFIHAVKAFEGEGVLFLICARNYVFKPTDEKAEALIELFLKPAPKTGHDANCLSINISGFTRQKLFKILQTPKVVVSNGAGGDPRQVTNFVKRGGFSKGSAGNYNLVTKALDLAVEDLTNRNSSFNQLKDLDHSKQGASTIPALGRNLVEVLRPYWGKELPQLGVC